MTINFKEIVISTCLASISEQTENFIPVDKNSYILQKTKGISVTQHVFTSLGSLP